MRKQEPQIYRVMTFEGPRYIHAIEVRPGILMHPDLMWGGQERDWDYSVTWSLSHKDSGRMIVGYVRYPSYAKRAASILARQANHVCEMHWLIMDEDYARLVKKMIAYLEHTDRWPADL